MLVVRSIEDEDELVVDGIAEGFPFLFGWNMQRVHFCLDGAGDYSTFAYIA